ncbi:MAG: cytochrome bc complex cytochrome b subunit [Deltaproteobacteria bacterium]|nr:cytochrome bc complex cytochrome b subunit [Deltaproteobacteria bacterium]
MAYVISHLGRVTFLLFLINVVSGIMLSFYYLPSSPYNSVSYIVKNVEFGLLTRSIHHWSAYLLIFLVLIHLLRSLLQGKYKVSGKSWIVGSLMGLLVLGCSFTGHLLVWNQESYWSTIIGIRIVETLPYIGGPMKTFLLGGYEVTTTTTGRFYALHTLMLPALLTVLMVFHMHSVNQLWEFLFNFMRRLGIVGTRGKGNIEEMDAAAFSSLSLELMEIFYTIGVVLLLASLFPQGIGEKANPLITPAQVKPEWYFLFIYQALKYIPKETGAVLFFLIIPILIILLPLIDRGPSLAIHPVKRPLATILVLLGLAVLFSLTIFGWLA